MNLAALVLYNWPIGAAAVGLWLTDVYRNAGRPTLVGMTTPTPARHRDFSAPAEPITFTFAPDTFICRPDISIGDLAALAERYASAQQLNQREQVNTLVAALARILEPESYDRLLPRVAEGAAQPIGMRLATEAVPWLLEMFGLVPTTPSSDSAESGADGGTGSTGGDSPTE